MRRFSNEQGRFTLIFLAAPGQEGLAEIELTHNWDPEDYDGGRNFGHLAYSVEDVYDTVSEAASDAYDYASDVASDAYDTASDFVSDVGDFLNPFD